MYWVSCLYLNCLMFDLTLAELSILGYLTLAEL